VLLDGRRAELLRELLDVGGQVERLELLERQPVIEAPAVEGGDGPADGNA
jgi:hypothetical protein